jgi:hypothetical protein
MALNRYLLFFHECYIEKDNTSLIIREMKIQITMRYQLTPRMAIIIKTKGNRE